MKHELLELLLPDKMLAQEEQGVSDICAALLENLSRGFQTSYRVRLARILKFCMELVGLFLLFS